MKILAGALLAILALAVFAAKSHADDPKCGEIEPAVITCDSGAYGRCQKADRRRDGIFYIYFCKFTGKQTDYCPMSMYSL